MADGDAAGGNDQGYGEIDLTWTDKLRKMVSSDAEWEAIILKKMEEKRNKVEAVKHKSRKKNRQKEMGIESQEPPASSFSVGGIFSKIKSYIPTRKGGGDGGHSQAHDSAAEVDGTRDQLMESQ